MRGPDSRKSPASHSSFRSRTRRPRVLRGLKPPYKTAIAFGPDSRYLVSGSYSREVWRWSLDPKGGTRLRLLHEKNQWLGLYAPSFDGLGRTVVVSDITAKRVLFIPMNGGKAGQISLPADFVGPAKLRRDGKVLAVVKGSLAVPDAILVRDLLTGDEHDIDANVEKERELRAGTARGRTGPRSALSF